MIRLIYILVLRNAVRDENDLGGGSELLFKPATHEARIKPSTRSYKTLFFYIAYNSNIFCNVFIRFLYTVCSSAGTTQKAIDYIRL